MLCTGARAHADDDPPASTQEDGGTIVVEDDRAVPGSLDETGTVTVLEVRGDQIRIGIDAPRSVKVHREEVFQEIERTNAEAVASAARARRMLQARPPRQD